VPPANEVNDDADGDDAGDDDYEPTGSHYVCLSSYLACWMESRDIGGIAHLFVPFYSFALSLRFWGLFAFHLTFIYFLFFFVVSFACSFVATSSRV
jgi:hypothetical protein